MKIFGSIFLFALFIISPLIYTQDLITFDDQNWSNNQPLTSNLTIGNYLISSNNNFYTNYGFNFDIDENSLYYVFLNPNTDKITITIIDGNPVDFISVAAYQVSENCTRDLIFEGWNNSTKLYSKSFSNLNSWQMLNLNFNNINKIIIKLSNSASTELTDYNFDNFKFQVEPMPVELTSFKAMSQDNNITLIWQTATEINNYGFDVERSPEGAGTANWRKIGFVEGNGTSSILNNYSYIDNTVSNGNKYIYRLKQIDNNGDFKYSQEIQVSADLIPKNFSLTQNYPNPFNPVTSIQYSVSSNQFVSIKVYDIVGHEIATLVNEKKQPGNYEVQFNASSFPSGIYIYNLVTEGYSSTKKMVLLK